MSLKVLPIAVPQLLATQQHWMPYIVDIARRQHCFVEQRLADVFSGELRIALLWDEEKKEAFGLVGYKYLREGPTTRGAIETAVGIDHKRLRDIYHRVEDELFRDLGCIGVSVWSRPGWAPDLKRWGYKLQHVQYIKDFQADAKHDEHEPTGLPTKPEPEPAAVEFRHDGIYDAHPMGYHTARLK